MFDDLRFGWNNGERWLIKIALVLIVLLLVLCVVLTAALITRLT